RANLGRGWLSAGEKVLKQKAHQWRKWRSLVRTIAAPAESTASTISLSRTEPPGWITAVIPALRPTSTPSAKGKKASEAITAPWLRSPARSTAIWDASTRLI